MEFRTPDAVIEVVVSNINVNIFENYKEKVNVGKKKEEKNNA